MQKRRFYVPSEAFYGDCAIIKGDQAHHLVSVLRKKAGDEVVLFDGKGTECLARVLRIDRDAVVARIERTEAYQRPDRPSVALYAAVPKGRRFDLVVEAATELGADTITPLLTGRSVVTLAERDISARLERWKRITIAAAKQCLRSTLPLLNWPVRFLDVAATSSPGRSARRRPEGRTVPLADSQPCARMRAGDAVFAIFACLDRDSLPIQNVLQDVPDSAQEIRAYIGPEGGFTPEETAAARNAGFRLASLGENTLRTETAAIAALSVIVCSLDSRVRNSASRGAS